MNKKVFIGMIIAIIIIPIVFSILYTIHINKRFKLGMDGISKLNVGVFYCSHNDEIPTLVDMIKTRLKAKVYQIDTATPYPKNAESFKKRIKQENENIERVILEPYDIDFKKFDYLIFATPIIEDQPCPALKKFALNNKSNVKNKFVSALVLYKDGQKPGNAILYFNRRFHNAIWKPTFVTKMKDMKTLNYEFDLWFDKMEFKRKEFKK